LVSINWQTGSSPRWEGTAPHGRRGALCNFIFEDARGANGWFSKTGPSRVLIVGLAALLALSPVLLDGLPVLLSHLASGWAGA
jgi:hypothetical protein